MTRKEQFPQEYKDQSEDPVGMEVGLNPLLESETGLPSGLNQTRPGKFIYGLRV